MCKYIYVLFLHVIVESVCFCVIFFVLVSFVRVDKCILSFCLYRRGDQPLLAVSASNMSAAWGWAARAFDAARPTRVIVHGFGSNCENVWVYEMRSALMAVVSVVLRAITYYYD